MKCKRWMPWQLEAMKDVGTCDKFRGGGNQPLLSENFRMGKPTQCKLGIVN